MARSYRFGDFELDGDRGELRCLGERVPLEPKTFDVLAHLVRHRDQTISVSELLRRVWPDIAVGRGSVHRAIRLLRQALAVEGSSADGAIETLPRRGYRFKLDAREIGGAHAHALDSRRGTPDGFDIASLLGRRSETQLEGPIPTTR